MDTEKLLPLPGRDCGPETGHAAIRTDESILAWGRANLARAEAERDAARAEVQRLREALIRIEALLQAATITDNREKK